MWLEFELAYFEAAAQHDCTLCHKDSSSHTGIVKNSFFGPVWEQDTTGMLKLHWITNRTEKTKHEIQDSLNSTNYFNIQSSTILFFKNILIKVDPDQNIVIKKKKKKKKKTHEDTSASQKFCNIW